MDNTSMDKLPSPSDVVSLSVDDTSPVKLPSPNDVVVSPSGFHLTVFTEVSTRLLDQDWVNATRHGTPGDPYWSITVPGFANDADKRIIAKALSEAGWPRVHQCNLGELNKCWKGMYQVTIYANESTSIFR